MAAVCLCRSSWKTNTGARDESSPLLYIKSHIFNLSLIYCWFSAQKIILSMTFLKKKVYMCFFYKEYINVTIDTQYTFKSILEIFYIILNEIFVHALPRKRTYPLFLHWTLLILRCVKRYTKHQLIEGRYIDEA